MGSRRIVDLTGRTALVTGALGGLGVGICQSLTDAGATVVATDRVEVVGAWSEAETPFIGAMPLELSLRGTPLLAQLRDIGEAVGQIDILVHNAGIFPRNELKEVTDQEWDEVMDINLSSAFRLAKALAPELCASGRGRIISTSSISWRVGLTGLSHYQATKAGLIGFTHSLARELGPAGVTVNSVLPGAFPTAAEEIHEDRVAYEAHILQSQCLKRRGTAQDLGDVVAFLSSDAAAFITGQSIIVDGGWVLD